MMSQITMKTLGIAIVQLTKIKVIKNKLLSENQMWKNILLYTTLEKSHTCHLEKLGKYSGMTWKGKRKKRN